MHDYRNMTEAQLHQAYANGREYCDDEITDAVDAELDRRREIERRHQETLEAIKNNRGGLFGFGSVATVIIVLWLLGYHFH